MRKNKMGYGASLFVTLSVSALWHGLYPGYFICFFFGFITLINATNLQQYIKQHDNIATKFLKSPIGNFILK